jgi:putative DNA primase/helicase
MMDYASEIEENLDIGESTLYPHNDIGIARLFSDFHSDIIRYVVESKSWYFFNGRQWIKDNDGFKAMELCKIFVQSYHNFMEKNRPFDDDLLKFAKGLHGRKRRENILNDARSIRPMSLSEFDKDKQLFNCENGTFNLATMEFQPHNPNDYITKISSVEYEENSSCARWESFISEVMSGDEETAKFLQKSFGYCLSGETYLECFFILYGSTTRNGKTTMCETISHILGDYARTAQPETIAKRSRDGSSPSPDIARLKGARLVSMPEPEKSLELNSALIKQLTGGDTFTGRLLHENPIEITGEFKIFINTNHLPRTNDDTIFSSGRVKLIPFNRHFSPEERDTGLKKLFREKENMSGILNWLIEGYRLLKEEDLTIPPLVQNAIANYRQDTDITGEFLSESLIKSDNNRLPTSELYGCYSEWAKCNGYKALSNRTFVGEMRHRYEVIRDCTKGNVILGHELKK